MCMQSSFPKWSLFIAFLLLSVSAGIGQIDPDPDSPVPVLMAGSDASRVLAVESRRWDGNIPASGRLTFRPSRFTPITIFVSNLDLMSDESRNAIRVYLAQRSG